MNSSRQAIHAQINGGLLSAICFLLPFMQAVRTVPFLSYLIALLILNWIISGKIISSISAFTKNVPAVLMASLYLFYLLGLWNTENEKNAFQQLVTKLPLIIFPLIISTSSITREQLKTFMRFFVYGCASAAIVIMVIAGYSMIIHGENKFYYVFLASPISMHPSYLASYFIAAVFISFHFLYDSKKKFSHWQNLFSLIIICFLVLCVILLSARAQIIALLMIVFVYSAVIAVRLKKYFLALAIPLILCLSLLVVYQTSKGVRLRFEKGVTEFENFWKPYDPHRIAERAQVWQAGTEVIEEHFWTGVGTGDVSEELKKKYLEKEYKYALKKNLNAHNQFMQTWIALGVAGFVLLLLIFTVPFYLAWKKNIFPALAFLGLMFISFQTEAMLERQSGTIFFCLFFSLFSVYVSDDKNYSHLQ